MGWSRLERCSGRWRGVGRATVFAVILALAGCGSRGHGAETDSEKASDAETLNAWLGQELTAVDAYTRGQRWLKGHLRAVGAELRAQEQEYVDAITKAIRGLGGKAEPAEGELDLSNVKDQAAFLALVYELEGAALGDYLGAPSQLNTAAPRTLDAALAAGHAQHLVVLRQALGAGLAQAIPEAFDGGEIPLPRAPTPAGRG